MEKRFEKVDELKQTCFKIGTYIFHKCKSKYVHTCLNGELGLGSLLKVQPLVYTFNRRFQYLNLGLKDSNKEEQHST